MDLRKGKKSALILSSITVLSFTLVTAILELLVPYLVSGDITRIIANPDSLSRPGNFLALVIFLLLLLGVMIAIGAYWLYRFFGDRHFGPRSALRWSIFGATFALLIQGWEWIFAGRLAILRAILQFVSIFGAYFLSRALIPFETTNRPKIKR